MKRESWNIENSLKTCPNLSKLDHSRGTRPSEFTPMKLGFFSSNSPKQVITCLGEKALSPSPTRLNMRREA